MPTLPDFTLAYDITGRGWATVDIASGPHRATMVVSSVLSTPLEDLALASLALLASWGAEAPRTFIWNGEPETWEWTLHARGEEALAVRIIHRDDEPPRATRSAVILDADVPRFAFAAAVLRAMRRLHDGLGPAEYEAQWRRPFPHELFLRLRHALEGSA